MAKRRKKGKRKKKDSQKPLSKVPKKTLRTVVPRNFWNTCPRKLELMPESSCVRGKKAIKNQCGELPCQWGVNSREHHYCFWKYVQEKSAPNGEMDQLMQDEVAKLLDWSSTKVHFMVRSAIKRIKCSKYVRVLAEINQSAVPDSVGDSLFNEMLAQVSDPNESDEE